MFREAVVKGYFYPDDKKELNKFFEMVEVEKKYRAKAVIVPHAGYIYSGRTAYKTLASTHIPNKVIIMGPNHTGMGEPISLFSQGSWETPFGALNIDEQLAGKLIDIDVVKSDNAAHMNEHCIEVVLPMLKQINPDVAIVPLLFKSMDLIACTKLAFDIYNVIKEEDDVMIVVSSDFNHYENSEITEKKDFLAIDCITALDAEKLYKVVMENNISMCGVYPAIIAILIAQKSGAQKGILIEHTNSAYSSGDYNQVVGYAGLVIV